MTDTVTGYRSCGPCTLCCKLPAINDPDLVKPAGKWCGHCKPGSGCKIHDTRPQSCRDFQCAWTQIRSAGDTLPEHWRPDKIKAYLISTVDGQNLHVVVDPARPDAWNTGELGAALIRMAFSGDIAVLIQVGEDQYRLVEQDGEVVRVKGVLEHDDGKTAVYRFHQ
jgi:hypothetical protein